MAKFLDKAGLERWTTLFKELLADKQDKLTGQPGQVVGFDAAGQASALDGIASKTYVDSLVGDVAAALDTLNGEVV